MGTWGHEIFQDDTNCDLIAEIIDSENPLQTIADSFDKAIDVAYFEHEECCGALVSAAIIDAILNGTRYLEEMESFRFFVEANRNLPVDTLKPNAVKALDRLLAEDSELNELWNENEELYSKWKDVVVQLKERLQ